MKKILLALFLLILFLLLIFGGSYFLLTPSRGSVQWFAEDTTTKGNWYFNPVGSPIGKYGSYAHILPNSPQIGLEVPVDAFSAPIGFDLSDNTTWHLLGNPPYNWGSTQINGLPFYKANPPYWDEYVTQSPSVTYHVNGTLLGPTIKYPVFEYAWAEWHSNQTEPREVYYNTTILGTGDGPGWILACWDDGGERSQPVNGYMNFKLYFPEGSYLLSLYAYDFEGTRSSQEYRIYDETGTFLLDRKQIKGSIFDEGVYETFKVVAQPAGLTIIVQVYNDAGHGIGTSNVVLSGIFVDKL